MGGKEMNQKPLISVIVPTYQRRASIERLLLALTRQDLPAEKYEVIIVVDGSLDGTLEWVENYRTPFLLKCFWQSNQGRAAAINRGIDAARGDVLVFLDDDMEPTPSLHPHSGVLGAVPIYFEPSSPPVMRYIGEKFNQHLERLSQPGYKLNLRDFYSGNFSIQRSVLLDAGLFNDLFKLYGNEDLELFWRLRQAGIPVRYCAEAMAIQHYEKDYAALARDNIAKGKTSNLIAQLHPDVMPEIKLSTYSRETLKWRLVRAVLLLLSRLWWHTPQIMIRFMTWLEKRKPAHLSLYYRLSLDYFYWLGAKNIAP
jgi:glycosyltransferase involved in cell wall biosynthesis